jgi:hypothetical protein
MAKIDRQTANVPVTAKVYQGLSDAQVGAAAMNGSPNAMFPKIPVPPAEVSWIRFELRMTTGANIRLVITGRYGYFCIG